MSESVNSTVNPAAAPAPDAAGKVVSAKEKADLRRKAMKEGLLAKELPAGMEEQLKSQRKQQKVRGKNNKKMLEADPVVSAEAAGHVSKPVAPEMMEVEVVDPVVADIAKRTPEVRFTKKKMMRPFNDDELKIIAAALRTRTPIYRTADILHCSYDKIRNAIENVPILKQLAEERQWREKEEVEEAVDACINARVPAVVMWKAEKLLPEKYGNQVNLDNEDDTKLVIGALSAEELAEADAAVEEAEKAMPEPVGNAVLDLMEQEKAAEMAAAGAGTPAEPLNQVPAAPAVSPPEGDPRFGPYAPAGSMGRVDFDVGFGSDDLFGGGDDWM